MVNIENYILTLVEKLKMQFGTRLLYVGLQGSYFRGEATEDSDIDIMVVLDELTVSDMDSYLNTIQSMEYSEKSCGFICSKSDLAHWNPLEICNLLNGTKDYYGVLQKFVPQFDQLDVRNFVKMSLNNLYHELCHGYIHSDKYKSASDLSSAYKCVFFILQNLDYLMHGRFVGTKKELLALLDGKNRKVLECAMAMKDGKVVVFNESFELLFSWCQDTLKLL
jgi:predicted nucleotidyltransferase